MGYTVQWVKGTLNSAPHALSRHPVSDPLPRNLHAERDTDNEPGVTIAEICVASSGRESV